MIGVGVVGYGYWGPNLVRNLAETPGAQIKAVADLDAQRLGLVQRRYPGVKTTQRLRDVLDDPWIDAVAVATPVATHFDIGMQVLQAGKHLWLEKPMTQTADQAKQLVEEADKRKRVLLVDHTFIYTDAIQRLAQLIRSDELGKVFYYDSTRINLGLFQRDASVICDLAVHDFAILDYLLGEQPSAVSASGVNHFPGTPENLAFITMYYDSGTIGHTNVSWLSPVKVRQILIGGSKKMVTYDDLQPSEKLKVYDKGVSLVPPGDSTEELRIGYRSGDVWSPKLGMVEALRTEGEHFVKCIDQDTAPMTDGAMGLRVVQLIEAAHNSMHSKGQTAFL